MATQLGYRRCAAVLVAMLLTCTEVVGAAQPAAVDSASSIAAPLKTPRVMGQESKVFLGDYYDSILAWGRVVDKKVVPTPGETNGMYVGRPRNRENDVRATAYSAMVLAFLAEAEPPTPRLTVRERNDMRQKAVGLLRYLAESHKANEGACVEGTEWGGQWQSALWTRAVGFTAWQLWPQLSDDLRLASARVVEFEADRFITQPPKSSLRNDTGAEENAWNGSICALACCMFPSHPRADEWNAAAKKYMYNTFSVAADATDGSLGDDGKPVSEWVTTINAHPDFTVENHRLVHIGYLKNSACMLQENATHWMLTGKPIPAACNHHVDEVFDVLKSCMSWNGSAIYFAGNDWRLYETQCSDVLLYSILARAGGSREAAYLERIALDRLADRQKLEDGFYNGRRDLEYSGLCATRLISCYLAHATAAEPPQPSTEQEFDRFADGVRYLKAAKSVLHRTPDKFASFTWAQQRMALTLAKRGTVVWPHYYSYLGIIDKTGPTEKNAPLVYLDLEQGESSFSVTGAIERSSGNVRHDFYFCSPESSYTVYVERLRVKPGHTVGRRWTGLLGVQAPIGSNELAIASADKRLQLRGKGGKEQAFRLTSDWMNLDDAIGYVVKRSTEMPNEMVVKDKIKIDPRRPHLHEWLSLVANDEPLAGGAEDWACIVTLPNADAKQTREATSQVTFHPTGDTATVTVFGVTHTVDFSQNTKQGDR